MYKRSTQPQIRSRSRDALLWGVLAMLICTAHAAFAQTIVQRPVLANQPTPQFAVPEEISQRFLETIARQQRARKFPIDLQWGIVQ
jgi:hypothetical protein